MFETTGTPAEKRPPLAVELGVAPAGLPPVRLPSPALRIIPGRSPLEATGWAARSTVGFVPSQRQPAA